MQRKLYLMAKRNPPRDLRRRELSRAKRHERQGLSQGPCRGIVPDVGDS